MDMEMEIEMVMRMEPGMAIKMEIQGGKWRQIE